MAAGCLFKKLGEKFMPLIVHFSYRHRLEGSFAGSYRADGFHLTEIGLDIFNITK